MATLTLEYNARNGLAAKTIEYILSLGVFKTREEDVRTTRTFDKSIKEWQSGKVVGLKDTQNPLAEILQ